MYKTLLVATDGSKLSDKALAHAIALAQAMGSTLTAFYAAPDYPMPAYADGVVYEPVSRKEYAKLAAEDAQKILDAAATKAEAAGVDVQDRLRDRRGAVGSDPRRREEAQVRRDRDGVARPPRHFGGAAGQRDAEGADAQQAAGDRRPVAQGQTPRARDPARRAVFPVPRRRPCGAFVVPAAETSPACRLRCGTAGPPG